MAHFDLNKDSGYLEIESAFKEAVSLLSNKKECKSFLDLTVMADLESVEIFIYDQDHICLSKRVIDSWAEHGSISNEIVIATLKEVLEAMKVKHLFAPLDAYRPVFINFVDDDYTILSELLYLDDSSACTDSDRVAESNRDFMKEFDIFIDGLISED